jgi:tRNA(Arg) A34 adenosine deaminase TadA
VVQAAVTVVSMTRSSPDIAISFPTWVGDFVDWERRYESAEDRMRLAIGISLENVRRSSGGPFGAAIFDRHSGSLVSVGMNLVVSHNNSALHAEMVALMEAERRIGSYSLKTDHSVEYELHASCDPCAMCLGAVMWSGVERAVCGARREDAQSLGFEEGPVFPESFRYLEAKGIEIVRGVLREEAAAVLETYRETGGVIYNG